MQTVASIGLPNSAGRRKYFMFSYSFQHFSDLKNFIKFKIVRNPNDKETG